MVQFKSDASRATVDQINQALGANVVQTFSGDPNLFLVKLPEGRTVEEAIGFYNVNNFSNVEYAEPNWTYCTTDTVPNDPLYSSQWDWVNINAPAGWDFTTGSYFTLVADNDTGIDYNHPDLVDNLWPDVGYDFYYGTWDPIDNRGHGSHTAGTIAAAGNNGIGVTGLMWSAQLMALKICDSYCDLSAAIQAIDFGVQNGARVSNNSWGGRGRSQALQNAIARADQAGVLFVAAAGNAGTNNDTTPFYPCNYGAEGSQNVICVASSTQTSTRSSFSCYGPNSVHLAAPGSSILSTYSYGRYARMSGTSMATPHVTGAVGLIWSKNPNLGHMQVKSILLNNVRSVPAFSGVVMTGGILDIGRALQNTP